MSDFVQAVPRVSKAPANEPRLLASRVRPFRDHDVHAIVALNRRRFPDNPLSAEAQAARFKEVCLRNPWYDERLSSLVYEDESGHVSGFLAVIPRVLSFRGRNIRVAVSQHLMVEPGSRSGPAAVQLLRRFLAGPQDLSMADWANEISRRLWERLGGFTSYGSSVHWRRPLRPSQFGLSVLKGRGLGHAVATVIAPLSRTLDAGLASLRVPGFACQRPATSGEPLEPAMLLDCLKRFIGRRSLVPVYGLCDLTWLFDVLHRPESRETVERVLVRQPNGDVAGWFIYWLNPRGASHVLQIGASPETIGDVLDHLFHHAWLGGATELSGRIDPAFMRAFSGRFCLFTPGLSWMLVHSRESEIVQTIDRGDAFLSRLEGDLWLL